LQLSLVLTARRLMYDQRAVVLFDGLSLYDCTVFFCAGTGMAGCVFGIDAERCWTVCEVIL